MVKPCAKCSLPFECAALSPECWCKRVTAWEPVRASTMEQYGGCLCQRVSPWRSILIVCWKVWGESDGETALRMASKFDAHSESHEKSHISQTPKG